MKKLLKKKAKTLSKLTKELDSVFSLYIRNRYADIYGMVRCFTCGVKKHWKEQQCGHFVSRSHRGVRWEEKNARPQCFACNCLKAGNMATFSVRLIAEEGLETVKALEKEKYTLTKFSTVDLQNMIDFYKEKYEATKKD